MDGTVLLEPFSESFTARNPVEYEEELSEMERAEGVEGIGAYSTADAMEVRERLRRLGYVD
jgi:hypothetical protein